MYHSGVLSAIIKYCAGGPNVCHYHASLSRVIHVVLMNQFVPLALPILLNVDVKHIAPGSFVNIPGTVLVVNVFSYRLTYLYIVLISRHFPNYSLLPPTLTPRCLPSPIFSCLYCYDIVIIFELEQFVKCLLFCYFTFLFCFACCAHFAACVFVQLLHDLKQHVVKQVSL